jgi:hypothetical protein
LFQSAREWRGFNVLLVAFRMTHKLYTRYKTVFGEIFAVILEMWSGETPYKNSPRRMHLRETGDCPEAGRSLAVCPKWIKLSYSGDQKSAPVGYVGV